MIQENEIVTLVLSIGICLFIIHNRSQLVELPFHNLVIGAFVALLTGQVLTVLEGFWYEETFNFLEHVCYAASSLLLAAWCWQAMGRKADQP